jgi:hypothetical protein
VLQFTNLQVNQTFFNIISKYNLNDEVMEYTLLIVRFTILGLRFFSYVLSYLDSLKFSVEFKDIDMDTSLRAVNSSDENNDSIFDDSEEDDRLLI